MMRDPVCGMTVAAGIRLTVDGYPKYAFCSEHCREAFLAEPARYMGGATGNRAMDEQEPADGDDDPTPLTAPAGVAVAADGSETVQLAVEGMTCASCVTTIERALREVPGVLEARVNFATEEATVDVVPGAAPTADLVAAVGAAVQVAQVCYPGKVRNVLPLHYLIVVARVGRARTGACDDGV